MKKIMMIAAMMVAAVTANAQNEVGQITLKPTVGLNIATMTKFDSKKTRPGVIAGLEAEYGVAEKFGLTAGLFYSMQGVKQEANGSTTLDGVPYSAGVKTTYKLDYLNIPILAQYYLIKGLAVKAGVQLGFNVSKKGEIEFTESYAGETEKETFKGKLEDSVKSFQFAIPVGLSYEYQNFVLDARYNIFLTKAFKEGFIVSDSRHSVFSFTLGYKFAL